MFKVLKRTGKTEDFNEDNIKKTVSIAADEHECSISNTMINAICREVKERLVQLDTDPVSSKDIFKTLYTVLNEYGYTRIATAYKDFEDNFWKDCI